MVETIALKIVQTVDFWIWAIIISGFFLIPWKRITLRKVWFRYVHCFSHLFIIMAFCCRGHWFDFYIVPVWVVLFFNCLWLASKLHLLYEAQIATKFNRRLDNLEEFVLTQHNLEKYKYKSNGGRLRWA